MSLQAQLLDTYIDLVSSRLPPREELGQELEELHRKAGAESLEAMGRFFSANLIVEGGRLEDAIPEFEAAYRADRNLALALFGKALCLMRLKRYPESLRVAEQVIKRFYSQEGTPVRLAVAISILCRSRSLERLNRGDAALAGYDRIVSSLAEAEEHCLRRQAARALVHKGRLLRKQRRLPEALECLEGCLERFGEEVETALRQPTVAALLEGATVLERMERLGDSLTWLERVQTVCGLVPASVLEVPYYQAMLRKSYTLRRMGKAREADTCMERILRDLRGTQHPRLQAMAAEATNSQGLGLILLWKPTDALRIFDKVIRRFEDTPDKAMALEVATAMAGKAMALARLGRYEDAKTFMARAQGQCPGHPFIQSMRLLVQSELRFELAVRRRELQTRAYR